MVRKPLKLLNNIMQKLILIQILILLLWIVKCQFYQGLLNKIYYNCFIRYEAAK